MVGILGIIALIILGASFKARKDGGIDGRSGIKLGLVVLAIVIFIIASLFV